MCHTETLLVDVTAMPENEADHQKIKAARLNKAGLLVGKASVTKDFLVCVLTAQLLNPIVKDLFEQSKDDELKYNGTHQGPIFNLVSDEFSQLAKAGDFMTEVLVKDSPYWNVLRSAGLWTPEVQLQVQCLVLHTLSMSWYRGILFYRIWPWPLARVVDARIDPLDQATTAEEFLASNACCLDQGFSIPLLTKIGSAQDLLNEGPMRSFLSAAFGSVQSQT